MEMGLPPSKSAGWQRHGALGAGAGASTRADTRRRTRDTSGRGRVRVQRAGRRVAVRELVGDLFDLVEARAVRREVELERLVLLALRLHAQHCTVRHCPLSPLHSSPLVRVRRRRHRTHRLLLGGARVRHAAPPERNGSALAFAFVLVHNTRTIIGLHDLTLRLRVKCT